MSATPPDSGESEVMCDFVTETNLYRCTLHRGHTSGAHRLAPFPIGVGPCVGVSLPLSLAQRILAALRKAWPLTDAESAEVKALADELRKIISCH